MENYSFNLYLEINNLNYIFFVGKIDEENNFTIVYKLKVPLKGFDENRVSDSEEAFKVIKENIYLAEQKLGHTFNEIVIILENLNPTFINVSGYKILNGSKILRENITYILNSLKSCIDKTEPKKTIIHIFNSNFLLDKKKIQNLPIGLFGDFYSHELSFALVNTNDFKNLENIFKKCNIKIKKVLLKSFIHGAYLSNNNLNTDTFFQIKVNEFNSKIIYFKNNSLKFEQNFNFGLDIIINDIHKITSLKKDMVKSFLNNTEFKDKTFNDEIVEKHFFVSGQFRKIKKKLIYEIAFARVSEILELMVFRNINLRHLYNSPKVVFFEFDGEQQIKSLAEIYKTVFSNNNFKDLIFLDNFSTQGMLNTTNKLVHFGWEKEVIPIARPNKSVIARFFDRLFR